MKKILLILSVFWIGARAGTISDANKKTYLNHMNSTTSRVGLGDLVFGGSPSFVKSSGSSMSGALQVGSSVTATSFSGPLTGVTDASDAAAGNVGEYSSVSATSTNIGTSSITAVATMVLTPGDWDVSGVVEFQNGVTSVTQTLTAAVSTSRTAYDSTSLSGISQFYGSWSGALQQWIPIPSRRFSSASSQTIYLLGQVGATTYGTNMAIVNNSIIRARRVR